MSEYTSSSKSIRMTRKIAKSKERENAKKPRSIFSRILPLENIKKLIGKDVLERYKSVIPESSPLELEKLVKKRVSEIKTLCSETLVNKKDIEIAATAIAVENTDLKPFVKSILEKTTNNTIGSDDLIKKASERLSIESFDFVVQKLNKVAISTGFTISQTVLEKTDKRVAFLSVDKEGRKLVSFAKIDKTGEPVIALDLEGFECDTNSCKAKITEVIYELNSLGVPYNPSRTVHKSREGVLRNALKKKSAKTRSFAYLQERQKNKNQQKQK